MQVDDLKPSGPVDMVLDGGLQNYLEDETRSGGKLCDRLFPMTGAHASDVCLLLCEVRRSLESLVYHDFVESTQLIQRSNRWHLSARSQGGLSVSVGSPHDHRRNGLFRLVAVGEANERHHLASKFGEAKGTGDLQDLGQQVLCDKLGSHFPLPSHPHPEYLCETHIRLTVADAANQGRGRQCPASPRGEPLAIGTKSPSQWQ